MVKVVGGVVMVGRNFIVFEFNRYTALLELIFITTIFGRRGVCKKLLVKKLTKRICGLRIPTRHSHPEELDNWV